MHSIPVSEKIFKPFWFLYVLSVIFSLLLLQNSSLALNTTNSASDATKSDLSALLAFKSSILHDPQGALSSWNGSSHFCKWNGVTCGGKHNRVVGLDLASRGLVGSLPASIGNLSFLHVLNLYNNSLGGEIPSEFGRLRRLQTLNLTRNSLEGQIPANLSSCFNLSYFSVAYNNLVGKIPQEFGSLTKLTYFVIHYNHLRGCIPPSIGNLTSLLSISAAVNTLDGIIPDTFGQLENLRALGLGNNNLSGAVPSSIYNLSSLNILSLPLNQFTGELPSGIGFMFPQLHYLQLGSNLFRGKLPLSLANATQLSYIDLSNNTFTGKILVDFGNLQQLITLELWANYLGSGEPDEFNFFSSLANSTILRDITLNGNLLQGSLPNYAGNFSELMHFSIAGNEVSGGIPSWFGDLDKLSWLYLDHNSFTGPIPTEMGNLHKLQRWTLNRNMLSGSIPSSLGNLSLLNELLMEENRLDGNIPSSLGNCQSLIVLNLSHNNLSGGIPESLFGISSLSISLSLSHNHLTGSIPSNVGNLKNLAELDVSENQLSGEIPSSLGSCTSLQNLYLEDNLFQGPIPPALNSLRGIQSLDLSRNKFSGRIPEFLENLPVKNLNLSFNELEGAVPTKGVFANSSEISLLGNHRLCGGVHELQLPRCIVEKPKPHKKFVTEIVVISLASLILGVSVLSALVYAYVKKLRKPSNIEPTSVNQFPEVSYKMLLDATNGFSEENLIGMGKFSTVYKGMLNKDEAPVAVKVLNLQEGGASKSFMSECKTLGSIRHRNLARIRSACSTIDYQGKEFKALVLDYMPNGSLEKWLHSNLEIGEVHGTSKLNLLQRINIAIDVATALDYLHNQCQNPIVHCDLKPSNILLDNNMTAHVGDFGLARFLPELRSSYRSSSVGVRGTVGYAAPEYGLGMEVSTHGDVYSYGILLLEMMTAKRPTNNMFQEGLNLHNFARMVLPDRVMEIVDPILLEQDGDEEMVLMDSKKQYSNYEHKDEILEHSLISVVKIGVTCSKESPQERLNISVALQELQFVKDILSKQLHQEAP